MRAYYYLLFRLYRTLSEPKKQNDEKTILYLIVSTSTFLLCFFILTIILYIDFYFFKIVNQLLPNKLSVITFMIIIGFLNYWFFIKPKKFLNYNFKPDKKGGYAIILYIFILGMMLIFFANKNREKVFKEREKARIENRVSSLLSSAKSGNVSNVWFYKNKVTTGNVSNVWFYKNKVTTH